MAELNSTYELKIKTDADLKALQAAKAEFAEQNKVIQEAGGASKELEGKLASLDTQIGQRKLALYTQDLHENIAALKQAGGDASSLEKALAQTQKATGGGDKWEQLGETIGGGIKKGVLVAAAAAVKMVGEVGAENAKDQIGDEEFAREMEKEKRAGRTQDKAGLLSHADGLNEKADAEERKNREETQLNPSVDPIGFSKHAFADGTKDLYNKVLGDWIGVHAKTDGSSGTADEKGAESQEKQNKMREQAAEDTERALEMSEREAEIVRQIAEGHGDVAKAMQRQDDLARDIASVEAKHVTDIVAAAKMRQNIKDKHAAKNAAEDKEREESEAASSEMLRERADAASLREEGHDREAAALERTAAKEREIEKIRKRYKDRPEKRDADIQAVEDRHAAQERTIEGKNSEADAEHSAALQDQVASAELIAQHREREAAALSRAVALGNQLSAINKRDGGVDDPRNRADSAAAIAAYTAKEGEIKRKNTEADAATLASMQGQVAVAELLSQHQGRAAAAKERELKLTSQIRAIQNDFQTSPEVRAQLEAGARRKAALEENEIQRKHADADAQSVAVGKEQLAIQKLKLAGHEQEASLRQINLALQEKLFALAQNSELPPDQKARLKGLAEEEAALQRLTVLRDKFNKSFDKDIADKNKSPQQKAQERTAALKGERQEREGINKIQNALEAKRANARQRALTPAEKITERKKLEATRGKKTREQRVKEKGNGEGVVKDANAVDAAAAQAKRLENQNKAQLGDKPGDKAGAAKAPDLQPVTAAADKMQSSVEAAAAQLSASAASMQAKLAAAASAIEAIDISPIQSAISDLKSQIDEVRSAA